jgi:acetyl-CoA carboxylase biotin carboxyl carrier protein
MGELVTEPIIAGVDVTPDKESGAFLREKVSLAADLVDEYGLDRVELAGDGWKVKMGRTDPSAQGVSVISPTSLSVGDSADQPRSRNRRGGRPKGAAVPEAVKGNPISSPMMGIYYTSSSPGSKPYITEGSVVQAGEVIGLIEAMKVFNEITSPFAGTVVKMPAENGQLVQPGDVLVIIG